MLQFYSRDSISNRFIKLKGQRPHIWPNDQRVDLARRRRGCDQQPRRDQWMGAQWPSKARGTRRVAQARTAQHAGDQPAQRGRRWPNAAGGPARHAMAQARGGRLAQPVKPTGTADTRNGPYAFH